MRAVCHSLLASSRAPENWKRLDLGTVCTESAWRVLDSDDGTLMTRTALESLTATLRVPSDMSVGRLRVSPQLVELDLTRSLVKLGVLRDAFKACGGSLLRLDMTGVRFWSTVNVATVHGYSYDVVEQRLGEAFNKLPSVGGGTDLFESLGALRVFVARDADTLFQRGRPQRLSVGMLSAVQRCCPALEELVLGWDCEFVPRVGGPQAEVGFVAPPWYVSK